jgi:prephenate dehydrogenase
MSEMRTVSFNRIAILGTGLIGGSFALALRQQLPAARLTGFDREPLLAQALEMGAIDEAARELSAAVADADLVYIALPIAASIEVLGQVARHARSSALVTDTASTKRAICRRAAQQFKKGALFLGGHPMAGKETSGIAAAEAELFRGAPYLLVPPESAAPSRGSKRSAVDDARVSAFRDLLQAIGARPRLLDAETHDRAVAVISHLPQISALALAAVIAAENDDASGLPLALAGPGLRDSLRLAGSSYALWRDIALTNSDHLGRALERLAQAIEHLRNQLTSRELETSFAVANRLYKLLQEMQ